MKKDGSRWEIRIKSLKGTNLGIWPQRTVWRDSLSLVYSQMALYGHPLDLRDTSWSTLSPPECLMEFCKMTLTFESVDEILWCNYSNESSLPVLTHGAICFSEFYKMKFALGRNLPLATFGSQRVNADSLLCPWGKIALSFSLNSTRLIWTPH